MMCDYPYYFYEKNSYFNIYHYFFAKEGSEAGSYFNNFTKEFINRHFVVAVSKPFDFFNTFKESFVNFSSGIFEKGNKDSFVIDDFVSNDEIIRNKMIKLKKPNSFNIQKYLDISNIELGLNISKGIKINYNLYKLDNKFILRLEAPGRCSIRTDYHLTGEYAHIIIEWNKRKDKEPSEDNDNIFSTREYGEFNLDIPIKTTDFCIKDENPKIYDKKGIFVLEYELGEKTQNNLKFEDEDSF